MVWFSADFHLGHKNIIEYSKRPYSSVEVMDEFITNNFYECVKPGDTFYFFGDLSFEKKRAEGFFRDLSSSVDFHFIVGNHDKNILSIIKECCKSVSQIKNIQIGEQKITLCHFPMLSWHQSHFGAWQLFGHVHNVPAPTVGKQCDVGVDAWDFYPISYTQISTYMKTRINNWNLIKEENRR